MNKKVNECLKLIQECESITELNRLSDAFYCRLKAHRAYLASINKTNLIVGKVYNISDGSKGKLNKINRTKCVMTIDNRSYNVPISMILEEVAI